MVATGVDVVVVVVITRKGSTSYCALPTVGVTQLQFISQEEAQLQLIH